MKKFYIILIVFSIFLFVTSKVDAQANVSIKYKIKDSKINRAEVVINILDDSVLQVFLPLQISSIDYDRNNFMVLKDSNENGSILVIFNELGINSTINISCEVKEPEVHNKKLARIEPFLSEKAILIPVVNDTDFKGITLSKSIKSIKKFEFDETQAVFNNEIDIADEGGNRDRIKKGDNITLDFDKKKQRYSLIYSDVGENRSKMINFAINKLIPNLITITFALATMKQEKKVIKFATVGVAVLMFILMLISLFIQNDAIEFWSNIINYVVVAVILLGWFVFASGIIKKNTK